MSLPREDPSTAPLFGLPADARLQLSLELWESVASEPANVPLQPWQLDEIRRRKATVESGAAEMLDEAEFWRRADGES